MTLHRLAQRAVPWGAAVAAFGLLLAAWPGMQRVEERLGLDLLFALRGPRVPPAGLSIVALHPATLAAYGLKGEVGRLPRHQHARLIGALADAGARAIALDVVFAEPDPEPAHDRLLAEAVAGARRVVLLDLLEAVPSPPGLHLERRQPPLPALVQAAAAHGPFPLPKLPPLRWWWPIKGGDVPTMPVLAARVAGTAVSPLPAADEPRYLDFYGPPGTVPTVPVDQVLRDLDLGVAGQARLRARFDGHVVFIGYAAEHPSHQDRVRDDYETVYTRADGLTLSGVEVAATAYANLVEQRAPQPLSPAARSLLLVGWGLLLGLASVLLAGPGAVVGVLLLAGAYLAAAAAAFSATALWLPVAVPLLFQATVALFGGVLWNHRTERRARRRLGSLARDLLPPAVVDDVLGADRDTPPAAADTRFAVVLTTDIEGYASRCEGLSPSEAAQLMNRYFELVFPIIQRHGGSISQIDGDAILAFWLRDRDDPPARQAACEAALEIDMLMNGQARADAPWILRTRIGLHAGPTAIARLGAPGHHEYRPIGDTPNAASRLEGLAKHLGSTLLVSEAVVQGVQGLLLRPMGTFRLAGRSAALPVVELLGRERTAPTDLRDRCERHGHALAAFRAQRWDDAAEAWASLRRDHPDDGPAGWYLALARQHAATPPAPPWDAVIVLRQK